MKLIAANRLITILMILILIIYNGIGRPHGEVALLGVAEQRLDLAQVVDLTQSTQASRVLTGYLRGTHGVLEGYSWGTHEVTRQPADLARTTVIRSAAHLRAHAHAHANTHRHTHTDSVTHSHTRARARTHACTHSRTHARTHSHTHTHAHARTHSRTHSLTRTHALTHTRARTLTHARHARTHARNVLMHAGPPAHTYACTLKVAQAAALTRHSRRYSQRYSQRYSRPICMHVGGLAGTHPHPSNAPHTCTTARSHTCTA
jgi:hypothetical protein